MSWGILHKTLEWIEKGKISAHAPLFLHLFGEPLGHPLFLDMAAAVKGVWPSISFSTNGGKVDAGIADRIADIGFDWVTVSSHGSAGAVWARELLKSRDVPVCWQPGPDHNWAGQVPGKNTWTGPCGFERNKMAVVHWDGDAMACCITDSKLGRIGNVLDRDLPERENRAFELCAKCHLQRKEKADAEFETVPVRQERVPGHEKGVRGVGHSSSLHTGQGDALEQTSSGVQVV